VSGCNRNCRRSQGLLNPLGETGRLLLQKHKKNVSWLNLHILIFKYNQQDATLNNLFISVECSTCFRRFLRPSSGAQKLYIKHRVLCQTFSATCHCHGRDGTATCFNVPDCSISSMTVAGSRKGLTKYLMLYVQFLSS
jgi:hypothetical protein